MVFQKRLDYGFNGYRAPGMPRVPRSAKGKRSVRRKVDDNRMCAFDLLAAVAGKILLDGESSFSSSDFDGLSDKIKKALQDEVKPIKDEAFDQASCNGCTMDTKLLPKQVDHVLKEELQAPGSSPKSDVLDKGMKSDEFPAGGIKEEVDCHLGAIPMKFAGTYSHGSAESVQDRVECGMKPFLAVNPELDVSSEDQMVLDSKPSSFASSDSSVEVPHYIDHSHHGNSCIRYRDPVELSLARDDDDNMSRCTHPSTVTPKSFKAHRVGDRRIRKLLASKHWKAVPAMPRNGCNTDVEMKPTCQSRKLCFTRQRSQRSSFKRRKVFDRCSIAEFDSSIGWNGIFNVPDKAMKPEVSESCTAHRANDASPSVQKSSFESDEYRVQFSIKSFKVPEVYIDIPENATVGSLKRTVLDAVTAILGGGLHVGVLLQGKKVRDDNKTLFQAGISGSDKVDCVGFTLEPSPQVVVPTNASPALVSPEASHHLPCESPQPLARIPSTASVQDLGISGMVPEVPLAPIVTLPESDHDSVQSYVEANSQALVPVPSINVEALAVVPAQKPRRSEIVQRRIRRPFSVGEVEALVQAVEKLGTGRWRDVKLQAFENAKHRTYVDLKDKWKTLVHTARISPQQRRGEPVPQELLDRVLAAHAFWSQQHAKLQAKSLPAETLLLH